MRSGFALSMAVAGVLFIGPALAGQGSALERSRLFSWSRGAQLAEESFRRCYADAQRGG